MTQIGKVIKSVSPGLRIVEVERESSCGKSCTGCGACSVPVLSVLARDRVGSHKGDRVLLESSTGQTLTLAALVYLAPLVLFFAGWFIHPAASAVGILLGLIVVFWVNRLLQKNGGIQVDIIAVIPPELRDRL